jgi:DnaJ family protein C protein 13
MRPGVAMDMLSTLMTPMHDNYDLAQEQNNKKALLASKSARSSALAWLSA